MNPSIPKIYGITASRASRNLWLLEELGVAYVREVLSYKDKATHTPAFLAINPNGHIPALVDGECVIWESLAINLYLARKYGGVLTAESLAEEGACLKWSFWAVTELEKDALTVLMHRMAMPVDQRKPELADQAESSLRKPMAVLEAHLVGKDFLMGNRFTVLDVNMASICSWLRAGKTTLAEHPNVARWLAACLARPAFLKVQGFAKTE